METEEWREVPDYPGYDVSNMGQVRSWRKRGPAQGVYKDHPDVMRSCLRSVTYPYLCVNLSDGKRKTMHAVHCLMLAAFKGPRPDGMDACHNDGVRVHNFIENLRWDTPSGNCQDKLRHGTARGYAKLTPVDVVMMRSLFAKGARVNKLADQFGIDFTNVYLICKGKTWKDTDGPITPSRPRVRTPNGQGSTYGRQT
jgi:hypothetical protein